MPESTVAWAVCRGCELAEWHPYCTSVRADHGYGERIDMDALETITHVTLGIVLFPLVAVLVHWAEHR